MVILKNELLFILGPDAIRPIITEYPNETYDKSDIKVNVLFGCNSRVFIWTKTHSIFEK